MSETSLPASLAYDLQREDFVAWVRECAPGKRHALTLWLVIAFVGGGLWSLLDDFDVTLLGRALAVVLLIGLAAALAWLDGWRADRRKIMLLSEGSGAYALDLSPSHLTIRHDGIETRYPWQAFARIVAGKAHVFLALNPDKGIIVPQRAFADEAQMRHFHTLAELLNTADEEAEPQQAPESPIVVALTSTQDDQARLTQVLTPGRNLALWKAALMSGVIGAALTGVVSIVLFPKSNPWLSWAAAGLPGALLGPALAGFLATRKSEQAARQQALPTPRRLTLDAKGLLLSGEDFESRFTWQGVERVINADGFVLFYLRSGGFISVPQRCLPPEQTQIQFYQAARAWIYFSQGQDDEQEPE